MEEYQSRKQYYYEQYTFDCAVGRASRKLARKWGLRVLPPVSWFVLNCGLNSVAGVALYSPRFRRGISHCHAFATDHASASLGYRTDGKLRLFIAHIERGETVDTKVVPSEDGEDNYDTSRT